MAQRHDSVRNIHTSSRSRPSDKGGGGDGYPDPEIRGEGGLKKNVFGPPGLIFV